MASDAANQAPRGIGARSKATGIDPANLQATPKRPHPATHPTAKPDPEDSRPRRPASAVGASGEYPCNGPTGPCVLELGHPGNHWRPSPALHFSKKQDCSICRRVHGQEVVHAAE